jgi:AcrR family transcriptional regulator
MSSAGLRERKKGATKDALSQAALDLAIHGGLDAVTAESIAEAANVSTRTFHNYFSSKEDAVLFVLEKAALGLVEAFAERSATEPVLDSLEAAFIKFMESSGGLERTVAVTRLMVQHPALVARHIAFYDDTSTALLSEIGKRTGTDPDVDLYPRLVYHAAVAVGRAVLELQISGASAQRRPADLVRQGFTQLRHGLPQTN